MPVIHDIRRMVPQFDPNFFAPYDRAGKDYPKMIINKETGKPFLDKLKKPIIVDDEHEEKSFLAQHYKPEVAQTVEVDASPEIKRGPGRPPLPKNLTA